MEGASLRSCRLGIVPYAEASALQQRLAEARRAGELPDTILLLEHPPVLTKGRRADPRELGMGEEWYRAQGIEVADSDRGGRVTYHGPGQLVAYPIVDLTGLGPGSAADVRAWVAMLERVMIAALERSGVPAQVFTGLTGVWTAGRPPIPEGARGPEGAVVAATDPARAVGAEARKIGSIGIHVSHGISTHGLAVNVNNDLQPFEWVVPCGIEAARMTSVAAELGALQDLDRFAGEVETAFASELARRLEPLEPAALGA
ncbi:MAG: lipoyl(octanoyl) transferase LipB [Solirubrobacterales bacterium]|nr:lipoyl(octanoyl) transferase LipB [Solirubrobacterales bacterium]